MTALERLAAAIEAGDAAPDNFNAVWNQFGPEWPIGHKAALADEGSLDAAKALHDAVLPGWVSGISQNIHDGRWFAWVQTKDKASTAYSDTPARAWLLAIVRALIAKEGKE